MIFDHLLKNSPFLIILVILAVAVPGFLFSRYEEKISPKGRSHFGFAGIVIASICAVATYILFLPSNRLPPFSIWLMGPIALGYVVGGFCCGWAWGWIALVMPFVFVPTSPL